MRCLRRTLQLLLQASLASGLLVSCPSRSIGRVFTLLHAHERETIELYRTVAEQDPEWFKEFVQDVLQEDVPGQYIGDITNSNCHNTKEIRAAIIKEAAATISQEEAMEGTEFSDGENDRNRVVDTEEEVAGDETGLKHALLAESKNYTRAVRLPHNNQDISGQNSQSETLEPEKDESSEFLQPIAVEAGSSATGEDAKSSDPLIVLYRDLYSGSLIDIPLEALTTLGYTMDEIRLLQPDALSLIVEDGINKPTRGVPQQWKLSPSQKRVLTEDVRIVAKAEAGDILSKAKSRKPLMPPSSTAYEFDRSRKQGPDTADSALERRRRRSRMMNGSTSSRNDKSRRERTSSGNSDPPFNKFWMDMETFRDLLRREAELRIRILGEDWKGTVKRESQWRLDLYKEWLWSLSDGVGEPIVESRVPAAYRGDSFATHKSAADSLDQSPTSRRKARRSLRGGRKILDPRKYTRPGRPKKTISPPPDDPSRSVPLRTMD